MLLETAAVLGREFETDLLVALVGDQEHVFDGIEVLRRRQLIESRGADGVRFIHDAMREAIYAAVAHETRRALHLRIAQPPNCVATDGGRTPSSCTRSSHTTGRTPANQPARGDTCCGPRAMRDRSTPMPSRGAFTRARSKA